MCFGPVASFTAGGFLASMGIVIFKNIKSPKELLLAAFPIIFAAQQLIEGFIWLIVQNGEPHVLEGSLTFIYLVFAYSLWPVLCPASVYAIEYNHARRKILRVFILLGALVSAYLFFFIIKNPVYAVAVDHNMTYKTFVARAHWFAVVYVFVTILPYFVSSHRSILVFGVPNLIFCAIAYLVYRTSFISVWCFFAAVISANLYVFLRKLHHQPLLPAVLKLS